MSKEDSGGEALSVMRNVRALPEESIPTRYSLLSRLENWGDQESWKEFFDTYWRLIYSVALRSGLNPTEAQDVVQETVLTVARSIHTFERDRTKGSFKGWLRNVTRWRIMDQLRTRQHNQVGDEELKDLAAASPDLEAIWDQEWEANLLAAALERVKRVVKAEHFQIFDLSVKKGWPVRKIASLLHTSIPAVYVARHRVARVLKRELTALKAKQDQPPV